MKSKTSSEVIFLFLLFLISLNIAFSQSIGVTPEKTVNVKTNTPITYYLSVSQGSDYAERITIEGDCSWLDISEKEFILESKTKKQVKLVIDVKKQGTYAASLRVCGSRITADGAVLSAQACTSHKLKVIATLDTKTKIKLAIGAIMCLALVIYLIYSLKKILRKKPNKKLMKPER